jgi:hypothetical protein
VRALYGASHRYLKGASQQEEARNATVSSAAQTPGGPRPLARFLTTAREPIELLGGIVDHVGVWRLTKTADVQIVSVMVRF